MKTQKEVSRIRTSLQLFKRAILTLLLVLGPLAFACQPDSLHIDSIPAAKHDQISSNSHAIIGGKPDSRHPAVGALAGNGRNFCTGTLIASRVVLTAAHCVDAAKPYARSLTARLEFKVEYPDLKDPNKIVTKAYAFDKKLLLNHPGWNGQVSVGNDVGLIILKNPITDVSIIPFSPAPMDSKWVGQSPLFLGFGMIQSVPNAVSAPRKYGANIPIIRVTKDRFDHRAQGRSVCHGDSGGPALLTLNGRLVTIGVNSYVSAPRASNNPPRSRCDASGTSMRTDYYAPFIRSILAKHGDGLGTCKEQKDCGKCGTCDKTKGKCAPIPIKKDQTTCGGCSSDSDCNGGVCVRTEHGYRCLQKCNSDNCCPSDFLCVPPQDGTKQWICAPKNDNCPDLACKNDKDCGPGELCNQGLCRPHLPPRSAKLCQSCQHHDDCGGPNHLCYGPQKNKQCLQPCNKGDFCPSGFTCLEVYPGTPKQCVPTKGTCHVVCKASSDCPKGYACANGTCKREGGGSFGDTCEKGSCKAPLKCVATLGGNRCVKPCGMPAGNPGSFCGPGRQCNSGARCLSLSRTFHACTIKCSSNADCEQNGGGTCSRNGNCLCQRSSQCKTGFTCNFSTRYFGACAAEKNALACDANQECRNFAGGQYCVLKGAGSRSLGDRCDSMNRCSPGLVCIGTEDGARCFEDCSSKRACLLGGRCQQLSQTLSICLCQGNDCPQGRTCERVYYQGRYGYCKRGKTGPQCLQDNECPPFHKCTQGKCVAQPKPKPENPPKEAAPEVPAEPKAEPKPEPAPEPKAEAAPEPTAEKASAEPKSQPDAGPTVDSPATINAGGGCSCDTASDPIHGSIGSLLILLLFFIPLLRRKTI